MLLNLLIVGLSLLFSDWEFRYHQRMKITKHLRTYWYQQQSIAAVDFAPGQGNCIISLTTVPSRLKWIKPTLISLLKLRPTRIELNLPRNPMKSDVAWEIPAWLSTLSAVDLYWLDQDYGPASKWIPTLARYQGTDQAIVVVDDDMIYPDDLLHKLMALYQQHGGRAAFCCSGHRLYDHLNFFDFPRNAWPAEGGLERVAIMEGCGGYVISPQMIPLAAAEAISQLPRQQARQDDIWLSGLLSQYGVAKYFIPSKRRKGTINTITPAIDGDRVHASNQLVARFKPYWHAAELDTQSVGA